MGNLGEKKGKKSVLAYCIFVSPFMSHESLCVHTLLYLYHCIMCTPPMSTDNGPSPTHGEKTPGILQGGEPGVEGRRCPTY